MDSDKQTLFEDSLIHANRALLALDAIDPKEPYDSFSRALHDCLHVYTNLLTLQQTIGLNLSQSTQIQVVIDCLKSHLQRFGEDV